MEHFPEFFANNLFLCIAFIVILMLTIRAEVQHQSSSAFEMSPLQATRLMNNENAVVVDVSDAKDYAGGHIKNAINIPLKELKNKLSELQKYRDKEILTCCQRGNQSMQACKVLKQSDFNNVHNISGGIHNWLELNLPTVKK